MRLYRGIAVASEKASGIIEEIRRDGLLPGKGWWTMMADNLKPRLEELWALPAVTLDDLEKAAEPASWICACAEQEGALYYALKHNRSADHNAPLLITFEADTADVVIDGRDFLFTLFQFGDPAKARPAAERLFGPSILRYVDRAFETDNQDQRIALCRLAVQDAAVIEPHAANRTVIAGRYGTRFRSAFLVRTPVAPSRIVDVRLVEGEFELPEPEITLETIR